MECQNNKIESDAEIMPQDDINRILNKLDSITTQINTVSERLTRVECINPHLRSVQDCHEQQIVCADKILKVDNRVSKVYWGVAGICFLFTFLGSTMGLLATAYKLGMIK